MSCLIKSTSSNITKDKNVPFAHSWMHEEYKKKYYFLHIAELL